MPRGKYSATKSFGNAGAEEKSRISSAKIALLKPVFIDNEPLLEGPLSKTANVAHPKFGRLNKDNPQVSEAEEQVESKPSGEKRRNKIRLPMVIPQAPTLKEPEEKMDATLPPRPAHLHPWGFESVLFTVALFIIITLGFMALFGNHHPSKAVNVSPAVAVSPQNLAPSSGPVSVERKKEAISQPPAATTVTPQEKAYSSEKLLSILNKE